MSEDWYWECPKCGSTDVIEWTVNGRVGMECRDCSHTWDPTAENGEADD